MAHEVEKSLYEILKKYEGCMAGTYLTQNQQEAGRRWKFGDCEFIEIRRELVVRGEPVKLESKPLEVLQHILEHPTQVLTKDELIGAAWSTSTTDQSLTTAISKLHKAFGGPRDSIILSVSGIGYRMAVPVTCEAVDDQPPPPLRLQAGDVVPGRPNWKVIRSLAVNGLNSVWLAEHSKTREARVFKFATDGVRLRALQREVTLSRLLRRALGDNAGFVRILDWDFEHEPFFIESEYAGQNLLEWSETEEFRSLPLSARVALAAGIVETVAAAHSLGILHNDLKPANVLIVADTDRSSGGEVGIQNIWRIKVADFGVASVNDLQRLLELQITHYGSFEEKTGGDNGANTPVGTAMYRAPELLAGAPPSVQADVYALGIMLYQIVSGDFLETPTVGWESRISDPILRQDIADAANIDTSHRIASASELAIRMRTLESRRSEMQIRADEVAAAEQARRSMEHARLRRPWLIFAIVALIAGLSASLWFYRKTIHQRDLVNARNRTLSAMNDFLTFDLLGQGNPLVGQPQVSLIEAMKTASSRIDDRFTQSPAIAGQLHESIASALDARTDYADADREFEIAAQRFRDAEGPLSQDAMICEFRSESTEMRSRVPASMQKATEDFGVQQKLAANLHNVSPEFQAWEALAQSAVLMMNGHAYQAVPVLTRAVQRAENTAGFSPTLLTNLKLRYCTVYFGLSDWKRAESTAREAIRQIQQSAGPNSPLLFQPKLFLEEALFQEGKFRETIAQGSANYEDFKTRLGPQNQMTYGALEQRAAAEGSLGDYDDAIRDDLTISTSEHDNPSGRYVMEETLSTAATFECRAGRFRDGLGHARQVVQDTSSPNNALPYFTKLASFAIAECLLSQEEASAEHLNKANLDEAEDNLRRTDIQSFARNPGMENAPGDFYVAEARLALLRGRFSEARDYAEKAKPFESRPDSDPIEQKALFKVESALARHA
jgi:eukaryotic-like serine/threonine-protein kinase